MHVLYPVSPFSFFCAFRQISSGKFLRLTRDLGSRTATISLQGLLKTFLCKFAAPLRNDSQRETGKSPNQELYPFSYTINEQGVTFVFRDKLWDQRSCSSQSECFDFCYILRFNQTGWITVIKYQRKMTLEFKVSLLSSFDPGGLLIILIMLILSKKSVIF